jgi:uncharacterized membrane protein
VAYGGDLLQKGNLLHVVPKDGLRKKIYYRNGDHKIDIELVRDGFKAGEAVVMSPSGSSIRFTIENRTANAHELPLMLKGLSGTYEVRVAGAPAKKVMLKSGGSTVNITIPVGASTAITLTKS